MKRRASGQGLETRPASSSRSRSSCSEAVWMVSASSPCIPSPALPAEDDVDPREHELELPSREASQSL
jgi:hypothetical protein